MIKRSIKVMYGDNVPLKSNLANTTEPLKGHVVSYMYVSNNV